MTGPTREQFIEAMREDSDIISENCDGVFTMSFPGCGRISAEELRWIADEIDLLNGEVPESEKCCANEDRNMDGGCNSCGDPCL